MARITHNPKILSGKPIIKGTRISVDFILELMASGMTARDMIAQYPSLEEADIREALEYAARNLKREEVVFAR